MAEPAPTTLRSVDGEKSHVVTINSSSNASSSNGDTQRKKNDSGSVISTLNNHDGFDSAYYLSKNYVGSLVAIGLAGMAGVGGFSLIAPILSYVNADLGPDANIVWVSLANTLTSAIMMTLAGRLSDIFGRRYFQIGGTTLALIGCIVGAVSKNVPMLIGANVLIGMASATQLSFGYLIAEVVPMKRRYLASSYVYALLIPMSGVAPVISTSLIESSAGGWRSCYYIMIGINAVALVCWTLFYHPPTWDELTAETFGDARKSRSQRLKQLDYGGLFLLSAGLLLFLMGISWGGSVYAWKSAAVLSTVLIGGVCLIAFVFYELHCPTALPLVPMTLFANRGWVALLMTYSMATSMYYAFSIVFPTQVAVLYADESEDMQGWLKCVIGAPPLLGQIVASLLVTRIGHIKWQLVVTAAIGAALYAANACVTSDNRNVVVVLLCVGGLALGWVDAICLASLSVSLKDQALIGAAIGVASSTRTTISTAASAIFTSILNNRLASTIPALVPAALVAAGLPSTSVEEFLTVLTTAPTQLPEVAGVNATIIEAGMEAYKTANANAYSTVYLTTIAFSALGVIFSFMGPEIDSKLIDDVRARLKT